MVKVGYLIHYPFGWFGQGYAIVDSLVVTFDNQVLVRFINGSHDGTYRVAVVGSRIGLQG